MAPALLQAATLALRATGVCSAQPQCPQEDKCNYVTNNESFQVNCATDFYGGDLKNINTATLADCITACGTTDSCVAISYVGQVCYMKNVLEGGVSNTDVTGAYIPSSATFSPSASSTPTPTSASYSAPAATTIVTTTASGSATTDVPTSASGPAATSAPGAICPSTYTCPENDGCKRSGSDGRTFVLACGNDVYGNVYASRQSSSLDECNGFCAADSQCASVSYTGGNSPGYCYLKYNYGGLNPNPNVDAFYYDANSGSSSPSSPAAASPSASPSSPVAAPPSSPIASPSSPVAAPPSSPIASPSSPVAASPSSPVASPSSPVAAPPSSPIASPSSPVAASPSSPVASPSSPVAASPSSPTASPSSPVASLSSPVASPSSPAASPSSNPRSSGAPLPIPLTSGITLPSGVPQLAPQPSSATSSSASPTPDRNPAQTPTPITPLQLVVNPSFESGLGNTIAGWTVASSNVSPGLTGRVAGKAHTGTYAFQAYGSSFASPWTTGLTQNLPIVAGKSYSVEFYAKQAIPGNCHIDVNFNGILLPQTAPVPLTFYTQSIGVIPGILTQRGGGSLSVTASCGTGGAFSTLWIDDVTVTAL